MDPAARRARSCRWIFSTTKRRKNSIEACGGAPDLVLSDMAAPTTGHRRTDHLRTMHLCEVAAYFAVDVLKEGGHFLAKTFQGGTEADLLNMLKKNFKQVIAHQAAGLTRRIGRDVPACQGVSQGVPDRIE